MDWFQWPRIDLRESKHQYLTWQQLLSVAIIVIKSTENLCLYKRSLIFDAKKYVCLQNLSFFVIK